ncbi:type II toxin-antitoxin system RelE/ParE family toxin [Maridesulfovibrio ferrireducens]|uniref:type II toxin-antitoxin system RelE/ParE family toxin n=1 Tax=Maridesulfovibrio ferrireducens TaxID=246191 RepID=UPI001A26E0E5|nr:type II toxin-antitoxin system RelE/ParE family toxin [Maridesulfovibrio ferrireducens]MBI9112278.1 type II toxin-antitoxin system RelE/ParE family toxin [Maridesulfovibrio ferrireducens]
MLQIHWKEDARKDLLSILGFIGEDNPEAARKLKLDLEARVDGLLEFPKAYKAGRVAGTREMVLSANYIVVYAESSDQIIILRILHAARMYP